MPTHPHVYVTMTLEILHCAICSAPYGVPRDMTQRRRNDGRNFYCPAGHPNAFKGDNKIEQLEKDNKRLIEEAVRQADELAANKPSPEESILICLKANPDRAWTHEAFQEVLGFDERDDVFEALSILEDSGTITNTGSIYKIPPSEDDSATRRARLLTIIASIPPRLAGGISTNVMADVMADEDTDDLDADLDVLIAEGKVLEVTDCEYRITPPPNPGLQNSILAFLRTSSINTYVAPPHIADKLQASAWHVELELGRMSSKVKSIAPHGQDLMCYAAKTNTSSIKGQCLAWLSANPTKSLHVDELAEKIGAKKSSVSASLSQLASPNYGSMVIRVGVGTYQIAEGNVDQPIEDILP